LQLRGDLSPEVGVGASSEKERDTHMENSTNETRKPVPADVAKPKAGDALVEGAGTVGRDAAAVVVAAGTAVVDTAKAVVDVVATAGDEVVDIVDPSAPSKPARHAPTEVVAEAVAPVA
jgi:hypothetical protein